MAKRTQGQRLLAHLKRKPHTYLEMLMLGISTCPWRRVREALRGHPELSLAKTRKTVNGQELVAWRVIKSKSL